VLAVRRDRAIGIWRRAFYVEVRRRQSAEAISEIGRSWWVQADIVPMNERRSQTLIVVKVQSCGALNTEKHRNRSPHMDMTTLLVIVLLIVLLGGGGWYGRGRWYGRRGL
jgi:hypothetical protein